MGNSSLFVSSSSSEFVSILKSITIPEKYELVSFDVVLLFANVPTDLALSVVEKRLDDVEVSNHTSLSKEVLVLLLRLCLSSTTFYYNGLCTADLNGVTGVSGCN